MKLPLITLAPLLVEADDFVDEIDAGETAPLRLAYFLRDSSLLFSEQINVQHSFIFSFFLSPIECEWKKERKNLKIYYWNCSHSRNYAITLLSFWNPRWSKNKSYMLVWSRGLNFPGWGTCIWKGLFGHLVVK